MVTRWKPNGLSHSRCWRSDLYSRRNASNPRRIFAAKPGVHCHYLTWSPDDRFVYFVGGTPSTEEMDIWRIPVASSGQAAIRSE